MEKIKLSSYAKKAGKNHEEHSNHASVIEEIPVNQGKFVKYWLFYVGKPRKAQSRWKKFKSTEKILLKSKLQLKLTIVMSSFAFSAEMSKKISKCSNLSTFKAMK